MFCIRSHMPSNPDTPYFSLDGLAFQTLSNPIVHKINRDKSIEIVGLYLEGKASAADAAVGLDFLSRNYSKIAGACAHIRKTFALDSCTEQEWIAQECAGAYKMIVASLGYRQE